MTASAIDLGDVHRLQLRLVRLHAHRRSEPAGQRFVKHLLEVWNMRLGVGSKLGAAVDVNDVAGDPARLLGRKEGDDAADVVGLSDSLSACMPKAKLRPFSVLVKFDISVSTTPGATAFTRMPRAPST